MDAAAAAFDAWRQHGFANSSDGQRVSFEPFAMKYGKSERQTVRIAGKRALAARLDIQRLPPELRDEDAAIFAVPGRVAQGLVLVDRWKSFRVRGCSRFEIRRWTTGYVKLILPPRQSRGGSG